MPPTKKKAALDDAAAASASAVAAQETKFAVLPPKEMVAFSPATRALIDAVVKDVTKVPTKPLVALYGGLDFVEKALKKIKETVRLEMIVRRNEGVQEKPESRTRTFDDFVPGVKLQVQARAKYTFLPDVAETYLRAKKLWGKAVDTSFTADRNNLMRFLRKHHSELKEYEIEMVETLNEEKLDALVKLGEIPAEEAVKFYKQEEDTYAVIAKV